MLVFQLKRRPPDHVPKKTRKHLDGKPARGKERADGSGYGSALPPEKLPYLVELSPGEQCAGARVPAGLAAALPPCVGRYLWHRTLVRSHLFFKKQNLKVLRHVLSCIEVNFT